MATGIEVRILGPVRVFRDGEELAVGGTRARLTIAALAVHPAEGASRAAIAEALWDDNPPAASDNAIQVQVSRLRSTLGANAIRTTPHGYRFGPEVTVDVSAFAEARRAAQRGRDLAESALQYRQALAQWSGHALDDLRGHRFADEAAATLEEQRLATVESCLDAELALGRHAELVPELRGLTNTHPLRESFWALYMLALYRAGRQADALEAYRGLRRVLGEELGIEPQPRLRALEQQILSHDPVLEQPAEPDAGDAARFALTIPGTVAVGAPRAVLHGPAGPVEIDGLGVRIGRLPDNTVVVDDPKASRHHASITWREGAYRLSDLNTTNGTQVNGRRIQEHPLADEDVITIGAVQLTFRLHA